MQAKVTTTITTYIDLDTLETDHSTEIVPERGVPEEMAYAAVAGACKATLNSLPEWTRTSPADLDEDDS